jgi:serine/threonine-protein kinase RsbW
MKRFEFSIRNSFPEFEKLNPAVDRFLEQNRMPERLVYTVRLVLEELASNVIRHGSDAPGSCTIHLAVDIEPERLVIRVSDDGRQFDPTRHLPPDIDRPLKDRQPGGVGIHLVRSVADEMRYERREGWNHTEVIVAKPATN